MSGVVDSALGYMLESVVAVCAAKSLETDQRLVVLALQKRQERLGVVPKRFRPALESFVAKKYRHDIVDRSLAVDDWFERLHYSDTITLFRLVGGGALYRISMHDAIAREYLAEQAFSPDELKWLWELAQAMHESERSLESRAGLGAGPSV